MFLGVCSHNVGGLLSQELVEGIEEALVEVEVVADLLEVGGGQVGDDLAVLVHNRECALLGVVHGDEGVDRPRNRGDAEHLPRGDI